MIRLFIVAAAAMALGGVSYIYYSTDNPRFIELLVGTVVFGVLIGVVSSLVFVFSEPRIKAHPVVGTFVVACLVAFLVAVQLYLSNTPKALSRDIPITYLVDADKQELADPILFGLFLETTAFSSYMDAARMVKELRDKGTKPFLGDATLYTLRDLTEYLIPFFIGQVFVTPEATRIRREQIPEWLGSPHPSIASRPKSLDDIAGPLKDNRFYGMRGTWPDRKTELAVPKDMDLVFERSPGASTYALTNRYMEVRIRVEFAGGGSDAYVRPGPLPRPVRTEPFKRYDWKIESDATFAKFLYGSPTMRHYEKWANNLLAVLERKFAWGRPPLYIPPR